MEKAICEEIWKPIREYESEYAISNKGRIKSLSFRNNQTTKQREKIMKPFDNGSGYLVISLKKGGKVKNKYIHRLVAEAFLENYLPGMVVNHIDYNKRNNCVENLEWCTQKENTHHSKQHMKHEHNSPAGKSGEKYIRIKKGKFEVTAKGHYLGRYERLNDAIKIRDEFLKECGNP